LLDEGIYIFLKLIKIEKNSIGSYQKTNIKKQISKKNIN